MLRNGEMSMVKFGSSCLAVTLATTPQQSIEDRSKKESF